MTNGPAGAIFDSARRLTSRQRRILAALSNPNSSIVVKKSSVSMNDLRNLTLHTGDEFAMLTCKGQRMIIRGEGGMIPGLNTTTAKEFAEAGWRWSGHTHTPGFQAIGSIGDKNVLKAFGQRRSAVWGARWMSQPELFFSKLGDEILWRMRGGR